MYKIIEDPSWKAVGPISLSFSTLFTFNHTRDAKEFILFQLKDNADILRLGTDDIDIIKKHYCSWVSTIGINVMLNYAFPHDDAFNIFQKYPGRFTLIRCDSMQDIELMMHDINTKVL